jgi:hypothetical protein
MSEATETSIADLLGQTSTLEDERDDWQAERDALDARISARDRLIAALRAEAELRESSRLFDASPARRRRAAHDASSNGNGERKRVGATADGILVVLGVADGPMTSGEIYDELDRRGWAPLRANNPQNAVRQSLWNLAKQGKVVKLGDTPTSRRWASKTSQTQEAPGEAGT